MWRPCLLAVAVSVGGCVSALDDLRVAVGGGNCDLANCNALVGVYDHRMKVGERRYVAIAKPDNSPLPIWIWESTAPHVIHVNRQPCKGHVVCIELAAFSSGTATITGRIREEDLVRYPPAMRRLTFVVRVKPESAAAEREPSPIWNVR